MLKNLMNPLASPPKQTYKSACFQRDKVSTVWEKMTSNKTQCSRCVKRPAPQTPLLALWLTDSPIKHLKTGDGCPGSPSPWQDRAVWSSILGAEAGLKSHPGRHSLPCHKDKSIALAVKSSLLGYFGHCQKNVPLRFQV